MLWLWILAAETAYFIKGLCGFVNALVFTSISSFGVSNADSSPSDLLLAGSIPGALLLKTVDIKTVKLIFGVVGGAAQCGNASAWAQPEAALFLQAGAGGLHQLRHRKRQLIQSKHQRRIYHGQYLPYDSGQHFGTFDTRYRKIRLVPDPIRTAWLVCGHQAQQSHG